jgi:hypothetical protein
MILRNSALTLAMLCSGLAQAQSTLTFQNGSNGYAGTQDTVIRSAAPGTNYGADPSISVDGDDGSPGLQPNHGLIRFDAIFGPGAAQIQPGVVIESATLSLNVFNPGSGWAVHDMLTDWAQGTATWNSLIGGVQANGVEAGAQPLLSVGSNDGNENVGNGLLVLDLTASLRAWQAGTLPGYGWALLPFTNGTNGIDFDSSEALTASLRPVLTVQVSPIPEPGTYALLLAGLATLGFIAQRRRG